MSQTTNTTTIETPYGEIAAGSIITYALVQNEIRKTIVTEVFEDIGGQGPGFDGIWTDGEDDCAPLAVWGLAAEILSVNSPARVA